MALIEYDITIQGYATPAFVQSNCNSITFLNLGNATATIDQAVPLLQNQSFTIDGNQCEHTNHVFQINFDTSTGTTQNLVVILKSYINN